MVERANTIFADGPVGSPSSPSKPEIRKWGTWIEGRLDGLGVDGGIIFATRALLYADLLHAANTLAWVVADTTVGYNGIYEKAGSSGTGSWQRRMDLPYPFIPADNVGAGTANAIQATTGVPISDTALVWVPVVATNTATVVTVQFNNDAPLRLKTLTGNDPAIGGIVNNMILLGKREGSNFRLVIDQVSSAVVADAEAAAAAASSAQTAAEAARDLAQTYASTALEATMVRGYLFGGTISNNASDGVNDLDIAAGVAASDDSTPALMTWGDLTRQADVAFGTGNGGRFDATDSDGTWHVFAITNGTLTNIGFSKSLNPTSAANYPSGYTKFRRIGSRPRASGTWVQVIQRGDEHFLKTALPLNGGSAISAGTTAALYAIEKFPTGIECSARLKASFSSTTTAAGLQLSSPLVDDVAAGVNTGGVDAGNIEVSGGYQSAPVTVRTNTSAQIRYRAGAAGSMYLVLTGWVDNRGADTFKGGGSGSATATGVVRSSNYATLQDAINDASGKRLIIASGSYVTSGLTGISNVEITTEGPVTISTTSNAPILDMTNCVNWSIKGHLRLVGSGTPYTGYPGSLTDSGQKGVKISNCDRYLIDGLIEVVNINGSGVYVENSANNWAHDGIVKGIRAHSCYHGIRYTAYAEYDVVSDVSISNCPFGILLESGNIIVSNAKLNFCSIAVKLATSSGNEAHGVFNACELNHCEYALVATGVSLGHTFNACHAIANQAGSGHGAIQVLGAAGIFWNGGQIGSDITVDATGKFSLMNAYIRTDLTSAPSVASGGVFNAKNNVASNTGGMWAYNN